MAKSKPLSQSSHVPGAKRVRDHRRRMRRAGMKLLQMWVPDPSHKGFAEECRRQSLLLRRAAGERKLLDKFLAVADIRGWR